MSKYDPLFRYLSRLSDPADVTFTDVEEILGFPLPKSARRYAAWWSNSGGTHVQSQAWAAAGYRTEQIDLLSETIRFVPERLSASPQPKGFEETEQHDFPAAPAAGAKSQIPEKPARHPAFGALKGMITLLPDIDYTEPADPDWGKVYDD
jgi:hypothetical protein